jgi:hypothetical protein
MPKNTISSLKTLTADEVDLLETYKKLTPENQDQFLSWVKDIALKETHTEVKL